VGLVTDGWGQNLRVLDGRRRGGLVRVEWMAVGFGRLEFEGPRDEMHGSRRIFFGKFRAACFNSLLIFA
jgi:hypothetical protein